MKVIYAAVKAEVAPNEWVTVTGKRHSNCFERLHEKYSTYNRETAKQGFLTDTYEFVDRYEAKKIAVAAKQLIVPVEETCAELYSEDVW